MADTDEDVLKRTIERQKEHIEILERHNEFLRNQLFKPRLTSSGGYTSFGQDGDVPEKYSVWRALKDKWFYIAHGLMMGTFIYIYLTNYDIIRDFYLR